MSTVIITSPTAADRAVRFHDECVLIPEPQQRSRMPRLVTKSVSLPLWKRRGSDVAETEPPSSVDFGFKVPMPRFTTKSFSQTRDEFIPQSCLVHQTSPITASPPSTPPLPPRVRRASSLPFAHPDLVTVPLRPCCADCETIWEESMKEGEEWKEKFTRGARRRRNSSSDAPSAMLHNHHHHAARSSPFAGVLSIKVDEVDQRRRSGEKVRIQPEDANASDDDGDISKFTAAIASLTVSIQEEDEDQLFPLPSPKRSPNGSPLPSPAASSSSLGLSGAKDTPDKCVVGAAKKTDLNPGTLLPPIRTAPLSPPLLPRISASAPLPSRNISLSTLPSDMDFLEADKLLSSPALSRTSRSPMSPASQKKAPKGNAFVKAGSEIFRGVIGLGSPPMM